MKKSAFTMIELIFVILILGILAVVAIPKLASLEDDALVSKEKSGMASARQGVLSIQARAKNRQGAAFNVSVEKWANDNTVGTTQTVAFDAKGTLISGTSSDTYYPYSLSYDTTTLKPVKAGGKVISTTNEDGTGLGLVLGADERNQWETKNVDDNTSKVVGPASGTVADVTAEYNKAGSWSYSVNTGRFAYEGNVSF